MSSYLGDFLDGQTVRKMWNSNAVAGESITRATNGTISVYKDGGTTQTTTGVTDTEDFDSLTGVHLCAVATTDSFYTPGSDFEVVLSAATIDGKTINATLFSFSIRNRSNATIMERGTVPAAGSTTATRLAAALTYANDIFNGGLLSFVFGTGKGQSTSITDYANTNDTVTHPAIALAASTDTVYEVLPYGLVAPTSGAPAPVDVINWKGSAAPAMTGDAYARLGAPSGASTSADIAAVKTDTAGVKTKTDFLPSATAGAAGGVFIAGTNAATTVTTSFTTTFTGNLTGSVASVSGAVGSVTGNVGGNVVGSVASVTAGVSLSATGSAAFTEGYATDGSTATLPQLLYMILSLVGEKSVSGTTVTTKKLDGTSTAMTYTLNSATAPTSITRAS